MNIPQEAIRLAREAMQKFSKSECVYQLAEYILREAGELPVEPPMVRVPDCLPLYCWVAVDSDGSVYLYDGRPKRTINHWVEHEMSGSIGLNIDADSLMLPKVESEEACWQVSELRKMQDKHLEWQAEREENTEVLPDGWIKHTGDECPVAEGVEVNVRGVKDASFSEGGGE